MNENEFCQIDAFARRNILVHANLSMVRRVALRARRRLPRSIEFDDLYQSTPPRATPAPYLQYTASWTSSTSPISRRKSISGAGRPRLERLHHWGASLRVQQCPNGPWSRYTIFEMLRNERYRGISVWGRTQKARNPETGRKVSRATLESQWRRVDVPEWRIVSTELWNAVQERRQKAGENFHQNGGMTRTAQGHRYLLAALWSVVNAAAAWLSVPAAANVGT